MLNPDDAAMLTLNDAQHCPLPTTSTPPGGRAAGLRYRAASDWCISAGGRAASGGTTGTRCPPPAITTARANNCWSGVVTR
jgi:hypothetical protein